MAVLYEKVYDVFRDKATEWELAELTDSVSEDILYGWLKGAINRFKDTCKNNLLDRDEINKCFNVDITEKEIDILAECMVYYAQKPKVNNSDLFRNGLSTKDFSTFSNANLLNAISERHKQVEKEINYMISSYSYAVNNVGELKKP